MEYDKKLSKIKEEMIRSKADEEMAKELLDLKKQLCKKHIQWETKKQSCKKNK
ncbi:hypothetical protein [Alkaliphilus pronyensis]|uniref:hypothetical protein n=1 Tax=Alkaliphilus pronyensis TaxID=1482732 RepID=UPI00186584E7|nr:hypothetical protein [Alkaliphilus pronyensis]